MPLVFCNRALPTTTHFTVPASHLNIRPYPPKQFPLFERLHIRSGNGTSIVGTTFISFHGLLEALPTKDVFARCNYGKVGGYAEADPADQFLGDSRLVDQDWGWRFTYNGAHRVHLMDLRDLSRRAFLSLRGLHLG